MYKRFRIGVLITMCLIVIFSGTTCLSAGKTCADDIETIEHSAVNVIVEDVVLESETESSWSDDVQLIALVTMAEAEGECEEGKRLVIDTILNRVDSEAFPDTVYDVVYQPNQFSSMWNGRVERCEVQDDICEMVLEEMKNRTNYDVVFFSANTYGKYGTPLFQVGNHYFSSLD